MLRVTLSSIANFRSFRSLGQAEIFRDKNISLAALANNTLLSHVIEAEHSETAELAVFVCHINS